MNAPSDKPATTEIARELRLLRETVLLCFGTAVLLTGLHIHSDLCVLVGILFLIHFLYSKIVHLFRLLHDAPLIVAIREAVLAPKAKPTPDNSRSSPL
jgi:hypothetical protein